jgi:hypothetical protein
MPLLVHSNGLTLDITSILGHLQDLFGNLVKMVLPFIDGGRPRAIVNK